MKRKFTINALTGAGIDEAIRGVQEYKRWLDERLQVLVRKAAELGVTVASAGFSSAVYDGTNDVSVTMDERGENAKAVVATGNATLFIEFGTGVMYPDNHPEKPAGIVGRGEYGKGHGKQRTWGYYGEDTGTNGVFATKKNGETRVPHVVLTHGNPANMPMYNAKKEIEQRLTELVREVFET